MHWTAELVSASLTGWQHKQLLPGVLKYNAL